MSRVPHLLGRIGGRLTELGERLDARRAEVEKEHTDDADSPQGTPSRPDTSPPEHEHGSRYEHGPRSEPDASEPDDAEPDRRDEREHDEREQVPRARTTTTPTGPGVIAVRPEPASVVPWGVRVAAEAGWRLLVLAGTLWVLMRVIGAVQLVVFAFVVALLITALLQPTVARLTRWGMPRGPATALTAILGFVVMGLIGWFVTWQVIENTDQLSDQVQDGIDELRNWLLNSPFHVTDKQINKIAENLRDAIGANTDSITSVGLEGVTVVVEALTGILLAAFSTLFLLYDGKRIWEWTLKLVPAAARPGVAGAGPRAWRTLTAYVRGTVIVALIDAIFIGLGIYFLDVPMAVPLAVFIFLFSFIPLVGAVASGALAVVVALVTQGVVTAVLVVAVVLAVQQIEGHVLQPFILGRAVRVHPLAVVLSVAAGGMVAGIGGAVVAVPLVAVTNTVVGYLRVYSQAHTQDSTALHHAPKPRGATSAEIALTKAQHREQSPPPSDPPPA
ncbi:AI-2E family transporter [Streptomyces sp. AK08-02]|uniref:AI-2E family transporter n=1 Tax=Streptomyces sp. AK08-02 TaxID=3028654 RepID=UPI0029A83C1A|nr:AI-2E family transporter [Streptomyces sp. AK08-02]MDX3751186.1 AI-2E family transporter [Streptomyces sp. AK08-02]